MSRTTAACAACCAPTLRQPARQALAPASSALPCRSASLVIVVHCLAGPTLLTSVGPVSDHPPMGLQVHKVDRQLPACLSEGLCQYCMVCVLNAICCMQVLQSSSEAMTAKELAQAAINQGLVSSSTKVNVLALLRLEA